MERLPNDISEILRDLYSYYPIGAEIANEDYDGYRRLQGMVTAKIDAIIENGNNTICPGLKESFAQILPHFKILTEYEKQFPNYAMSILLGSNAGEEEDVSTTLKIRISLLTKFYTCFFEQLTISKKLSDSPVYFRPVRKTMVSSKPISSDFNEDTLILLKNVLNDFFKNYQFISADLLLNHKIRYGSPAGFEIASVRKEFSLYDFLFDHEYCHPVNLIVET